MRGDELPPIVRLLGQLWQVPEALLVRWYGALCRCRWSEVRDWHRQLLLAQDLGEGEVLMQTLLTPQRVMRTTELLVQSRLLWRTQATRFEECLLACVTAQGAWQ